MEQPLTATALVLPGTISAELTIKIGQSRANSRRTHGEPVALQLVVSEGHAVFREKMRAVVSRHEGIEWANDSPIMVKPTTNATQAHYEELDSSEDALQRQLRRNWNLAARRRTGQAAFKLEVFIYVSKASATSALRRATQGRVAVAAARIEEHLEASEQAQGIGPASRAYWAVTQARQPDNAPIIAPTGTTFSQLQFIDQQQEAIDNRLETADLSMRAEFVTIRCRLNGGLIPLELHVGDLRRQLGLPAYSLVPPFREPIFADAPGENMEDVDHVDD